MKFYNMRCSDEAPKSHIRAFYLQNTIISRRSGEKSEVSLILQPPNPEAGTGSLWMAPAVCQRPTAEHFPYHRKGSVWERTSEFNFIFAVISVEEKHHCSGLLYFILFIFTCQQTSAKGTTYGFSEIYRSRIKAFLQTRKC